MMSVDWHISGIRVSQDADNGLADVIEEAEWYLEATDEGFAFRYVNKTSLNPPIPSAFTPLSQVTEQILKSWIGYPLTDAMMIYLSDGLERLKQSARSTPAPLPWRAAE